MCRSGSGSGFWIRQTRTAIESVVMKWLVTAAGRVGAIIALSIGLITALVGVGTAGYMVRANQDAAMGLTITALQQQNALLQPQATANDVTIITEAEKKLGKTVQINANQVSAGHLLPYKASKDDQDEQKIAVFAAPDQYITSLTIQASPSG